MAACPGGGHNKPGDVAPLVLMLWLMCPNPDRHGGQGSRQPSLIEAQAAFTIVQRGALACSRSVSQDACAASYSFITEAGMRPRSLICLPCALAHARTADVSVRRFLDPRA